MSGCNMCGTQVEVQIIYKTDRRQNIYRVFPRKRNLPSNRVPLAPFCLHRSCHSSQGKGSVMLNIHSNISSFHHSLIIYFPPLIFPFQWSVQEYKLHIDVKNLPFHLDLCRPFAAHWWVTEFKKKWKLENSELEN